MYVSMISGEQLISLRSQFSRETRKIINFELVHIYSPIIYFEQMRKYTNPYMLELTAEISRWFRDMLPLSTQLSRRHNLGPTLN